MYVFESAPAFHHIWFIKTAHSPACGLTSFQPQTNYTLFFLLAAFSQLFFSTYININVYIKAVMFSP